MEGGGITIGGMKPSLTASDKIQQICDALRRETLEPARLEAEEMLKETEESCKRKLREAEVEAERLMEEARRQIQRERETAQTQLHQAVRQSVSVLKQAIEEQVLRQGLVEELQRPLKDPEVIAQLIRALIVALERDGLATDLEAVVAQVDPSEVNRKLGQDLLQKLRSGSVELGKFAGGVRIKLHQQHLVADMSLEELERLLATYLRKDLRDKLFQS
jgi:V/A-type H+/Na+-transporting ATPase subunit E